MADDDELLADETAPRRTPLVSDLDSVVDDIRMNDRKPKWLTGKQLNLGAKSWRPAAVSEDGTRVLHVALQGDIPRHVSERLRLARDEGLHVCVALTIGGLFQADLIEILASLEAQVLVVDDFAKDRRFESRHVLGAVADVEVPLEPDVRKRVAEAVWSQLDEGTNQEKGERLEVLLAFLFSQISDLRVVERNFNTETEEIDLVLQIDNRSPRAWQQSGVPFILVEAKNTAKKATQQMMSVLLTKIQGKRGTVRLGFLVCPPGFSEEAKMQELRFSTSDICVAMLDREGIQSLIDAADIDNALEVIVRRSMLR